MAERRLHALCPRCAEERGGGHGHGGFLLLGPDEGRVADQLPEPLARSYPPLPDALFDHARRSSSRHDK